MRCSTMRRGTSFRSARFAFTGSRRDWNRFARYAAKPRQYAAARVIEIAEVDCLGFAAYLAERFQSLLDPVNAKRALLNDVPLRIEDQRTVRARLETRLASIALLLVHHYDPIVPLMYRFQWTGIQAWRLIALHAQHR